MNILDDQTVQSKAVLGVSGCTEEVSATHTLFHQQFECSQDFAGEELSMHDVMVKLAA